MIPHIPGTCFIRALDGGKPQPCGNPGCLEAIPESWRPRDLPKHPDTSAPGIHFWRINGELFGTHTFECEKCEGIGGFGTTHEPMTYAVECEDCDGRGVHEDEFCSCHVCKAVWKAEEARALLEAAISDIQSGEEGSARVVALVEKFAGVANG